MLRRRSVVALLAAEVVSTTGSQMTWVALPWFVLTVTGSPTQMAVVMAVDLASVGLLGILGGHIAARLGTRRTMLFCDLARTPLMAAIPVLQMLHLLTFPILLGLVFAVGLFYAPYFGAQRAIIPELVGEDERAVTQMGALFQGATRLTVILGPALAGVLLSFLGPLNVLLIDAATYLVAFFLVLGFVHHTSAVVSGALVGDLLSGLRFLVRDRLYSRLVWTSAARELSYQALIAALPVVVLARYGQRPEVVGTLFASWGAGALVGSGLILRVFTSVQPLRLAGWSVVGQALPLWLLLPDTPIAIGVGSLLVAGLFNSLTNAPLMAVATLRVPQALRAQVTTAQVTIGLLAGAAGMVAVGPAVENLGVQIPLMLIAAIATLASAAFALIALRW